MCRGLFRVATTRNVGQDLATFGDVGDMSATRQRHVELDSIDCITHYTANIDLSLQDHERDKLNRPNNRRTTPPISGDRVIGNLLHNQMILTPVAINANAHGRIGPMIRQNLYGTPPPDIPPRKQFQFKPNRPNVVRPPFQPPIGISSKQTRDGNSYNQTIHTTVKNSTDSAIMPQHLP